MADEAPARAGTVAIDADLQKLFDALDPPERITVVDVTGARHTCSGILSARAEIRIGRYVRELAGLAVEVDRDALLRIRANSNDLAGIAAYVLRLAEDDRAAALVAAAFATAHPEAARAGLRNRGVEVPDKLGDADVDALLDTFPLEELVAGLIPFGVRLAKRGTAAVAHLIQPTPAATRAAPSAP